MDVLSANVRDLDPDIIGITENWMDETISDAEVSWRVIIYLDVTDQLK